MAAVQYPRPVLIDLDVIASEAMHGNFEVMSSTPFLTPGQPLFMTLIL